MPDVWATVADLDAAAQERLAGVLERRGADAQQQAMRRAFLSDAEFGVDARVLEVGCGTGVLTRVLGLGRGGLDGIGFTVSLFIAGLADDPVELQEQKGRRLRRHAGRGLLGAAML